MKIPKTKVCHDCQKRKSLDAFSPMSSGKYGRSPYCRPCFNARRRKWRRDNAEHVRAQERARNDYKREHERKHRAPCPECGEPMRAGSGCAAKRPERCAKCRHEEARQRTARWLELRRAGLNNLDIAAEEGVLPHVIALTLQRSRVARFPDLDWLPAPYAAARGVAVV